VTPPWPAPPLTLAIQDLWAKAHKAPLDKTRWWREPDSNHRSRSCERLFWALPIGDGGTKGGATYRFRSETAMLAWSGCPQPFPSRRDREFESVFLQCRVSCELNFRRYGRYHLCGAGAAKAFAQRGFRLVGASGRDAGFISACGEDAAES
jgi:hypothetical protein